VLMQRWPARVSRLRIASTNRPSLAWSFLRFVHDSSNVNLQDSNGGDVNVRGAYLNAGRKI
jgi:hypothetical protein